MNDLQDLADANKLLQDALAIKNYEVAKMAAEHVAHLCRVITLEQQHQKELA